MKWLRIAFFITLAASGAFPLGHLFSVYGYRTLMDWLSPVLKSIGCYLLGVVVYGNQWPEAFWPGKFDHLGHSHQLWHLFVCGGIWYHYTAAVSFFAQREALGLCQVAWTNTTDNPLFFPRQFLLFSLLVSRAYYFFITYTFLQFDDNNV